MTRRDIIIISVFINMGLLAILLMTAVKSDSDTAEQEKPSHVAVAETPQFSKKMTHSYESKTMEETARPVDELDYVLKEYLPELPLDHSPQFSAAFNESHDPVQVDAQADLNSKEPVYIEITVKRGDALEKIARVNRTTIENIKKTNHLTTDKLKIGQVLKIPVSSNPLDTQNVTSKSSRNIAEEEPIVYTIKSGDNPWKIAKIYNVRFEDLLKLNNLDEDKAKNLKVGDKIRVK